MRQVRARISEEDRDRMAAEVANRLLTLPEVRGARTVMLFASFGSEIPTGEITARLLDAGKRVVLPFLEEDRMAAAALRPDAGGGALIDTTYGPLEPADRTPVSPREIEVVVTPGLAFDRRGHRLGYGGGHYDRFLASLPPTAARVGIGFDPQLLEEIPAGHDDQRLDVVITDRRTVRPGRETGQ